MSRPDGGGGSTPLTVDYGALDDASGTFSTAANNVAMAWGGVSGAGQPVAATAVATAAVDDIATAFTTALKAAASWLEEESQVLTAACAHYRTTENANATHATGTGRMRPS